MTNFTDYRTVEFERKNRETFCYNNGIKYNRPNDNFRPNQRMTADEIRANWDRKRNGLCY